jgi:hypothetical protein
MKIEVERNGKILKVNARVAEVLMRKGIVREAYQTRDMVAAPAPAVLTVAEIVPAKPSVEVSELDLDAMDKAELHALAKERGVKVHHMAGADKVREALRAAE